MERIENYKLPDGRVYTGECIKNFGRIELKGHGEIKYPNGDKYVGTFDDGFERGYGKYIFLDGDVHYGWFYDGTPSGIGMLDKKTASTILLGNFGNRLLNGWAIRMVNGRPPQFGWWKDGTLVDNMTNTFMWVFEKIRDDAKGTPIEIYDNGMFGYGIPQRDCQTYYGFLFNKDGSVSLGNAWNFKIDGHCAIFNNKGSLLFDEYNNGVFVGHSTNEDILWNFQLRVED